LQEHGARVALDKVLIVAAIDGAILVEAERAVRGGRRADEVFVHVQPAFMALCIAVEVGMLDAECQAVTACLMMSLLSSGSTVMACLERAHELLQAQCPEQPRELTHARLQLGAMWYLLGKHRHQTREVERWLAEARGRDDALAVALLLGMGYGHLRHLMRDDADAAIKEVADTTGEPAIVGEVELMRGLAYLARCEFPRAAELVGSRAARANLGC